MLVPPTLTRPPSGPTVALVVAASDAGHTSAFGLNSRRSASLRGGVALESTPVTPGPSQDRATTAAAAVNQILRTRITRNAPRRMLRLPQEPPQHARDSRNVGRGYQARTRWVARPRARGLSLRGSGQLGSRQRRGGTYA